MPTDSAPSDVKPAWQVCGHWPACIGVRAANSPHCLAHLTPNQRERYLARLHPGADLDARGTDFTEDLLHVVLATVHNTIGTARFDNARFVGKADFDGVRFAAAGFSGAEFGADAMFNGTHFEGKADFSGAAFAGVAWLGPLSAVELDLDRARFTARAEISAEADVAWARRTRFEENALLRLDRAALDLTGAVFDASSSIMGAATLVGRMPALLSLRNSDVGSLTVTDVDLSRCEFAGAWRLDQLRIAGRCRFSSPPATWRWTRRQVLAEESKWRGWYPDRRATRSRAAEVDRLAALYRSLRKALEDSKNEAGAGDFYYGEMEMRRYSTTTPRAERGILAAYWLLSGYGQRAARALAALVVLLAIVAGVLIGWGLPQPVQSGQATLAVAEAPAVLPPAGERWTGARAERAVQIALGAVVFRDAGQRLTSTGVWTVMVARFGGPLLLALAVLAIRARVKR